MPELWGTFQPLISYALGYGGILVAIALARPRVCLRIVEMFDAFLLQIMLFVSGAAVALTWARNFISDPANHGAFWGPEIGTAEDDSLGDRRIIFAHNAMADEQGILITAVVGLGLWLLINLGAARLCHLVVADKADDAPQIRARPEHHKPVTEDAEDGTVS